MNRLQFLRSLGIITVGSLLLSSKEENKIEKIYPDNNYGKLMKVIDDNNGYCYFTMHFVDRNVYTKFKFICEDNKYYWGPDDNKYPLEIYKNRTSKSLVPQLINHITNKKLWIVK